MDKLAKVIPIRRVKSPEVRHDPITRLLVRTLLINAARRQHPGAAAAKALLVSIAVLFGWNGEPGELRALLEELAFEKDEAQ
ncbi:MAG: hypothetical protein M0R37_12545 [Bacteroidales bacterium]|jgi:hypothetical protein|nr:hypothetical protein [Bacteroidales bacterium]